MKTLYLVRHAKSSWKDSAMADIDRPLNKRGKRDAPRIGAWLAERDPAPQALLTSPARRARATVELLAEALGHDPAEIQVVEALYAFDYGGGVLEALGALPDELESVLVVGHNPTFTQLVNRLSELDLGNLPTCGAVMIELDCQRWDQIYDTRSRALDHIWPKMLPRLLP